MNPHYRIRYAPRRRRCATGMPSSSADTLHDDTHAAVRVFRAAHHRWTRAQHQFANGACARAWLPSERRRDMRAQDTCTGRMRACMRDRNENTAAAPWSITSCFLFLLSFIHQSTFFSGMLPLSRIDRNQFRNELRVIGV
jgi:hypothetical protein